MIEIFPGHPVYKLVHQLDKASTTYGLEISVEKTKLMTNNTRGISSDIRIGGQNLETVQFFKYLGSVMTNEGSKQEILSRIVQTVGALSKLKTIWKDKNIALSSKIRMMLSLVILIFLYTCKTWTLTAELQRRYKLRNEVLRKTSRHLLQGSCYI